MTARLNVADENLFGPPMNFGGLPEDLTGSGRARAWVLPVPYEATTSYGKGTANGPDAIIAASRQVELYDREAGCEAALEYGIRTLPPLAISFESPSATLERLTDVVAAILADEQAPEVLGILGGEHSITPAAVKALAARRPDIVCVHIDAHADLRDSYEGTPNSHACAARRVLEYAPVFEIGIRNVSSECMEFAAGTDRVEIAWGEDIRAGDRSWLDRLRGFVSGREVYLTVDLDGLDPSIMPAVGTPEPGGLTWEEVIAAARVVATESAGMPVFDVVELAPLPGIAAPDFLAAKLVYRIMTLALMGSRS